MLTLTPTKAVIYFYPHFHGLCKTCVSTVTAASECRDLHLIVVQTTDICATICGSEMTHFGSEITQLTKLAVLGPKLPIYQILCEIDMHYEKFSAVWLISATVEWNTVISEPNCVTSKPPTVL